MEQFIVLNHIHRLVRFVHDGFRLLRDNRAYSCLEIECALGPAGQGPLPLRPSDALQQNCGRGQRPIHSRLCSGLVPYVPDCLQGQEHWRTGLAASLEHPRLPEQGRRQESRGRRPTESSAFQVYTGRGRAASDQPQATALAVTHQTRPPRIADRCFVPPAGSSSARLATPPM